MKKLTCQMRTVYGVTMKTVQELSVWRRMFWVFHGTQSFFQLHGYIIQLSLFWWMPSLEIKRQFGNYANLLCYSLRNNHNGVLLIQYFQKLWSGGESLKQSINTAGQTVVGKASHLKKRSLY